jgi:hypothetical protein
VHQCFVAAHGDCNHYTNFGDGRAYDASTVPITVGKLCGMTGWRLPTFAEAKALEADFWQGGVSKNPFSRSTWFGEADTARQVWTSSSVDGSPDFAWIINFDASGHVLYDFRGYDMYYSVRLVAGP